MLISDLQNFRMKVLQIWKMQAVPLGYAPPEQYKGENDTRSDIYSLGATIYHLLTARSPEGPSQFEPIRNIKSFCFSRTGVCSF